MIILNYLLSFAIVLFQLVFLIWLSTLIITVVNNSLGKSNRFSVREVLTRKILTRGFDKTDSMSVLLLLSFVTIDIFKASHEALPLLFATTLLLLLTIKAKLKTHLLLISSSTILVVSRNIDFLKYNSSSTNLNLALDLIFVEYGILVKALSLLLALIVLKDTFKGLYTINTTSSLLTSSILTIYIIKLYFDTVHFPYVLVDGLEFESFSMAFTSYASVCMHYISIYLIMNLYVFTRKRPRLFLNQL